MTTSIDVDIFKKAGFSFEEIESIKAWILDLEEGRIYDESEVFERLHKKISSNLVANV